MPLSMRSATSLSPLGPVDHGFWLSPASPLRAAACHSLRVRSAASATADPSTTEPTRPVVRRLVVLDAASASSVSDVAPVSRDVLESVSVLVADSADEVEVFDAPDGSSDDSLDSGAPEEFDAPDELDDSDGLDVSDEDDGSEDERELLPPDGLLGVHPVELLDVEFADELLEAPADEPLDVVPVDDCPPLEEPAEEFAVDPEDDERPPDRRSVPAESFDVFDSLVLADPLADPASALEELLAASSAAASPGAGSPDSA